MKVRDGAAHAAFVSPPSELDTTARRSAAALHLIRALAIG